MKFSVGKIHVVVNVVSGFPRMKRLDASVKAVESTSVITIMSGMQTNYCPTCGKYYDSHRARQSHENFHNLPSSEQQTRLRKAVSKKGVNNPLWKGDDVSYEALHSYIKRNLPKPKTCQRCCEDKPLDLANKSGSYLRDVTDWEWLCRSCHMRGDGRAEKLRNFNTIRGEIAKQNPGYCKLCDRQTRYRLKQICERCSASLDRAKVGALNNGVRRPSGCGEPMLKLIEKNYGN